MDRNKFIDGGYDIYVDALRTELKAKKAGLKERLASESDPARKEQLAAEIKQLRTEYRERVRNTALSLN